MKAFHKGTMDHGYIKSESVTMRRVCFVAVFALLLCLFMMPVGAWAVDPTPFNALVRLDNVLASEKMFQFRRESVNAPTASETFDNESRGIIRWYTHVDLPAYTGDYQYTLSQIIGSDPEISYDKSVYLITVYTDLISGPYATTLVNFVESGYKNDDFTFYNESKAGWLTVNKEVIVNGSGTVNHTFKFTITKQRHIWSTYYQTLWYDIDGNMYQYPVVVEVPANGSVTIKLPAGEYTIQEDVEDAEAAGGEDYQFDGVTGDGVQVTITQDSKETVTVTNEYTSQTPITPGDIPKTGDEMNLVLWTCLMCISGIILACLFRKAEKA